MATGERYLLAMPSHHFLSNPISSSEQVFEFDESDIWNMAVAISSSPDSGEFQKPVRSSRGKGKKSGAASSLPMNVPDWSKILRGDYMRENRQNFDGLDDDEEEEEVEVEEVRFPPHEFLAKQRKRDGMSVWEGIGVTLKGRDLSRMRNAIWKQTGFED